MLSPNLIVVFSAVMDGIDLRTESTGLRAAESSSGTADNGQELQTRGIVIE
jgi:hypothetical protein